MKKYVAYVGFILMAVAAVAYGAQYISQLGSHDLRWGTGTWVDNNGRTRYLISGLDIPFSYDNNIKIGNTNLYNLSSGVIGNWKVLYTNGSGTISVVALDNAGLVLTSAGPTSAPYFGAGGGGGGSYYNPAAVAITGGTIYGVTLGQGGVPSNYIKGIWMDGALWLFGTYPWSGTINYAGGGKLWQSNYIYDGASYDYMRFYTTGWGNAVADNVAMFSIIVNATHGGTLSASKKVFEVKDYVTPLFDVDGSGTATAKGGVVTQVANGYRRMNICNTGGIGSLLFTPQGGDVTCVDNVVYLYASGSWTTIGAGDNVVTKNTHTDNFNRTAEEPITAPWADGEMDETVYTNGTQALRGPTSTTESAAYYNETFTNNQYSECKIPVFGYGGPAVRIQNATAKMYELQVLSTSAATINRHDGIGEATQLKSCSGTFAVTDTFKITASGSTLTAYQNGTAITNCSATDATYTGGKPGLYIGGSNTRIDDWGGGDL